jgi:spoIIIJ-associated protein
MERTEPGADPEQPPQPEPSVAVDSDAPEPEPVAPASGNQPPAEAEPAAVSQSEVVRRLEAEGDIAADYLEGLLDITDTDGDIDLDVEGDRATIALSGPRLGRFVGTEGEALEALQELCRLAVQQRTGVRSRLMLDVAGYRSRKRLELTALGRQVAEEVATSGQTRRLEPMSAFERKMVHDGVAAVTGVVSESEGEEPGRQIVIRPAPAPDSG